MIDSKLIVLLGLTSVAQLAAARPPPRGGGKAPGGRPTGGGGGGAGAGGGGNVDSSSSAHAVAFLGTIAKTTRSGTSTEGDSFAVGEDIYGPFEAGFSTQQNGILEALGCSSGNLGHVAGGIDTHTAEQMVAHQCGVALPRYEGERYISLIDEVSLCAAPVSAPSASVTEHPRGLGSAAGTPTITTSTSG